jgi:hypothetical protein
MKPCIQHTKLSQIRHLTPSSGFGSSFADVAVQAGSHGHAGAWPHTSLKEEHKHSLAVATYYGGLDSFFHGVLKRE